MSLIKLENLNKTFGKGDNSTRALSEINLEINHGDFISIIGPSGSGKSTLLNILGCLDYQDSGTYILDGKNIKSLTKSLIAHTRNKKFGFIVQHFALLNNYTVQENVSIPLDYSKTKHKNKKKIIYEVLKSLNMEDKVNEYPSNLSGGQCQRVAIARALVNNPDVILADEPTGALDTKTGQEVMEIFKELNKSGKTVIIITHNMDIANQTNRIINIVDGKIIK